MPQMCAILEHTFGVPLETTMKPKLNPATSSRVTTLTVVNCNIKSVKSFLCLFCFRKIGNSELQP